MNGNTLVRISRVQAGETIFYSSAYSSMMPCAALSLRRVCRRSSRESFVRGTPIRSAIVGMSVAPKKRSQQDTNEREREREREKERKKEREGEWVIEWERDTFPKEPWPSTLRSSKSSGPTFSLEWLCEVSSTSISWSSPTDPGPAWLLAAAAAPSPSLNRY